jgi:translation initiation factor 5B
MAPRKKGGKKQADDWEAELGETPDAVPEASTTEDVNGGAEEEMGGGGLLAALKKNKNKRAKKGKPVDDFVEGEDPPATNGPAEDSKLDSKAPVEANFDEEDVFSGTGKKGKAGKKAPEKPAEDVADGDKDEEGGLKSKKEKEKEKREREKQRKKEQVGSGDRFYPVHILTATSRLPKKKPPHRHLLLKSNQSHLRLRSSQKHRLLLMRPARRRRCQHI